jgi:hypothetical protein
MWSPHGLGVRREDGSAVGAGRRRRSQAMWGLKGKVQLKCGVGRKMLVAVGRAPFKKGAPLSEGALPYCLLDWRGAQAPLGGLVISSFSLMQLRVDKK